MNSIAKQILVALLLAVLGITGAWGSFELQRADRAGHEQFVQEHQAITAHIAHNLTYPLWNLNRDEVLTTLQYEAVHPEILAILVYGDAGTPYAGLLRQPNGRLEEMDPAHLLTQLGQAQPFSTQPILKNGAGIGKVALYVTEERLQSALRQRWTAQLLQLLALMTALFGVLYVALSRVVIQPLSRLRQWVSNISPGEAPTTPPVGGSEEIDALAGAFAALAAGLDKSLMALKSSEEWHRVLFEKSQYALMTLSPPHWLFDSGNPAAIAMFGARDEAEFRTLGLWQLSPATQPDGGRSDERAMEMIGTAMKAGSTFFEWTHCRLSGEAFPASVLLTRVEINGRAFLQATVRDQTQTKLLESKLAQRDRLASMGLLAAGVVHEINNPLAYVMMSLEGLAQSLAPGEASEEAAKALHGVQRIREITRGLGAFSRLDGDSLTPVDLNRSVESAAAMARNELKFRASLDLELGPVPAVLASEGKLAQVFLNLLINAAHSINEGQAAGNQVRVRTWSEAGSVLAEVTDSGAGIAPAQLDRIWEPFFTTKRIGQGTGLGLAICRSIVEEFGGQITVTSQVGLGTCFRLSLPAHSGPALAPAAHAPAAERPLAGQGSRARILIIDDEDELRDAMRKVLAQGHDVVTAASGSEAQGLLAQDTAFDVILCDLMMPDVSGMDLHEWLNARAPALAQRMVFVSGGAFTPRAKAYLSDLSNARIDKPFKLAALRQIVADTFQASRSS
jgi:signal transduction histidine kinase/CheY-like chemotaxis protein